MPAFNRNQLSDLRGAARLAVEATEGVTGIVEAMHGTIQRLPAPLGRVAQSPPPGLTGFIYRNIKRGARLVGKGLDLGFGSAARLLPQGEPSTQRDVYRSVLNGVCGDHLAGTNNPLAIDMSLRLAGRDIDSLDPGRAFLDAEGSGSGSKILLLVHGLCMNDQHWLRDGHDHGASLAEQFEFAPLYLRYNSGLPIAANGLRLAEILEDLIHRWPTDVEDLVIVAHSMGGLVARSACHQGAALKHGWLGGLRKLIFLGTPHLGAPLERGGDQLQRALGLSPYSAPFTRLASARSAGITDLRQGTLTADQTPTPLPCGVDCYAAAAVLAEAENRPFDGWVGDGLVPLRSALGQDRDSTRALNFPDHHRWIAHGMNHQELLSRPEVYQKLCEWMQPGSRSREAPAYA